MLLSENMLSGDVSRCNTGIFSLPDDNEVTLAPRSLNFDA